MQYGDIPEFFTTFTELTNLELGSNQFTGTISPEWEKCTQLSVYPTFILLIKLTFEV
jgi:hypothetical protein